MTPRAILILPLILLFSACTDMVQSRRTDFDSIPGEGCRNSLGSYRLPMALLTVKVVPDPPNRVINFDEPSFATTTVADRRQAYCLDYLAAITAEDVITVQRSADGLLQSVTSSAKDRTPEIAAKLIEAGANFALAARDLRLTTPTNPLVLQFDPLDPNDAASANEALRPYGYCVFVKGKLGDVSPDRWCETNRKPRWSDPDFEVAHAPTIPEVATDQILYRTTQTYDVHVLRKRDPHSGGWDTFMTRRMEFPNLSPIFGIGVKRALFTTRSTTLTFSSGVLSDVTIEKGSEALGFVSIPLYLAQTVVDIPARMIQLKINSADQRGQLIEAQGKLIEAWSNYAKTAQSIALQSAASGDSGTRSLNTGSVRAALSSCVDAGGSIEQCSALLAGRPGQ